MRVENTGKKSIKTKTPTLKDSALLYMSYDLNHKHIIDLSHNFKGHLQQ